MLLISFRLSLLIQNLCQLTQSVIVVTVCRIEYVADQDLTRIMMQKNDTIGAAAILVVLPVALTKPASITECESLALRFILHHFLAAMFGIFILFLSPSPQPPSSSLTSSVFAT